MVWENRKVVVAVPSHIRLNSLSPSSSIGGPVPFSDLKSALFPVGNRSHKKLLGRAGPPSFMINIPRRHLWYSVEEIATCALVFHGPTWLSSSGGVIMYWYPIKCYIGGNRVIRAKATSR